MASALTGSCACGATTYHSKLAPTHLDFCYCVPCQRQSGAPFMAWMGVPKEYLVLQGPTAEFRLSSVATRTMCSKCGSALTLQYECYPHKTHVAAGTVTGHAGLPLPRVGVHIFVKSNPAWYQIPDDGVKRYEEFDDEFAKQFPEVVERLRKI